MAVGESIYAAVAEKEEPSAVCDSSKSEQFHVSHHLHQGSSVSFSIGVLWSFLLQVSQILDIHSVTNLRLFFRVPQACLGMLKGLQQVSFDSAIDLQILNY